MMRKVLASDLDKICEIESKSFVSAWNKGQFEYELNENPYSNLYLLEDEDTKDIIGYFDLWVIFERAEIATIAVNPKYRKMGYGDILMEKIEEIAMEELCETISLEVRVDNVEALGLYEKHGFITINTKEGYYKEDGKFTDAYFMMKGI